MPMCIISDVTSMDVLKKGGGGKLTPFPYLLCVYKSLKLALAQPEPHQIFFWFSGRFKPTAPLNASYVFDFCLNCIAYVIS